MSEALIVAGCLLASVVFVSLRANALRTYETGRAPFVNTRSRTAAILAILSFLWPAYIYFPLPVGPALNPYTAFTLASLVFTVPLLAKHAAVLSSFRVPQEMRSVPAVLASLMLAWKTVLAFAFYSEVKNLGFVQVLTVALPLLLVVISTNFDVQTSTLYRLVDAIFLVVISFAIFELITQSVAVQALALATVSDTNVDAATQIALLASEKDRGSGLRLQSVLPHPILLAELGAMLAVLALSKLAHKRALNRKWTALLAVALCFLVIHYTDSRTGIIIAPAGIAVLAILLLAGKFKSPRVGLLICSVVALLVAALVFGSSFEAVLVGRTDTESSSTASRVLMLTIGLQRMADSLWFGYGPGASGAVVGIQGAANVFTLDNLFLLLALDWGTPLAIAHYALAAYLFASSMGWALSRQASQEAKVLCAAACAVMFIYIASSVIVAIDSLHLFAVWVALIAISKARHSLPRPLPTSRTV